MIEVEGGIAVHRELGVFVSHGEPLNASVLEPEVRCTLSRRRDLEGAKAFAKWSSGSCMDFAL